MTIEAECLAARVALCGSCETYLPEDEAGTPCPMEHDDGTHRTRLRVGFVCTVCEHRPFFPTHDHALDHHREHREGRYDD